MVASVGGQRGSRCGPLVWNSRPLPGGCELCSLCGLRLSPSSQLLHLEKWENILELLRVLQGGLCAEDLEKSDERLSQMHFCLQTALEHSGEDKTSWRERVKTHVCGR